jgi:hypothetical protein
LGSTAYCPATTNPIATAPAAKALVKSAPAIGETHRNKSTAAIDANAWVVQQNGQNFPTENAWRQTNQTAAANTTRLPAWSANRAPFAAASPASFATLNVNPRIPRYIKPAGILTGIPSQ